MEQVMGIGPTLLAWKARVLPLNYTRNSQTNIILPFIVYIVNYFMTCYKNGASDRDRTGILALARPYTNHCTTPALNSGYIKYTLFFLFCKEFYSTIVSNCELYNSA